MSLNKVDVFHDYLNRDLSNLHTYKTCDDEESCIFYMFKNNERIYKELDPYNNIPKQVEHDKLQSVFNSNNILKQTLLNDSYITSVKKSVNSNNTNLIINTILMHLRPYIFSNKNINHTNIDDIKLKVVNTLKFEQLYMIDIQSQLKFLLRDETVQYIKEESKRGIGNHSINVKDEYIVGLLKHEINSYRNRYNKNHDNKVTNKEIGKIYYHGMSRFKTKDIFTIIRDTISKIISTINIEQNMINSNKQLDKWNTVLGNHNEHGIRQYTSIKLNNKKPPGMMFNMNY